MKTEAFENSFVFSCEREWRSIFERKVWSELKNGELVWLCLLRLIHWYLVVVIVFPQILMFLSFGRLREPEQQIPSSYDQIEKENERQPLLA